jgi:hypothetical protein
MALLRIARAGPQARIGAAAKLPKMTSLQDGRLYLRTLWQLFQASHFARWGLIDAALIALPPIIAFTRSRTVHVAITLITVPLIMTGTIIASYYA